MKKILAVLLSISFAIVLPTCVKAVTLDYKTAINKIEAKGTPAVIQYFEDGKGNKGKMVAFTGEVYSSSASLKIREQPNIDASSVKNVSFGAQVDRVGLCDNGWSKLVIEEKGKKVYGYAESYYLSSDPLIKKMNEKLEIVEESQVLNFPGVRDGLSVGEVAKGDRVTCTGVCNDNWSRISYTSDSGKKVSGFVQNSVLSEIKEDEKEQREEKGAAQSENTADVDIEEEDLEEQVIEGEALLEPSEGSSESIWAKAVTENLQDSTEAANAIIVNEGEVVNVSATAKLEPLGDFRITHYCACSICCGPYSGMNSTASGAVPVTNHTIAVDPKQIPYGTKVVVNGQVYVAEDCGSGIKKNCIDIYVASHEEASSKGMYHTDVYLLIEDDEES